MRFLIFDFPYKTQKSALETFIVSSRAGYKLIFSEFIDELTRAMNGMNRVAVMKMQIAAEKFHRFYIYIIPIEVLQVG